MKTQTKTTPNGTATPQKTVNGTNGTSTAITVVNIPAPKEETKQKAERILTIDERKEKATRLYQLFDKREKLKKHADELLAIVRADESTTTRFYLESSNGDEWQTTNQEFIKKTVKVMHEAILTKIEETETEIELIEIQ